MDTWFIRVGILAASPGFRFFSADYSAFPRLRCAVCFAAHQMFDLAFTLFSTYNRYRATQALLGTAEAAAWTDQQVRLRKYSAPSLTSSACD